MADTASLQQELRLLKRPLNAADSDLRTTTNSTDEAAEDEKAQTDGSDGHLNIWQAAFTFAGCASGYSLLAADILVVSTGWLGFAVFCLICAGALFTAVLLGRCWNIVHGDAMSFDRHPYGAIGDAAFGAWARSLINFLVAAISFSNSVGAFLATAETTVLLGGTALQGTFCYWPVIFGVVLCPISWLGTPKDFWWVMAFSYFSTVLATPFIVISTAFMGVSDAIVPGTNATVSPVITPRESEFLRLAEMSSFVALVMGAHFSLPTLQQDMRRPRECFSKAVVLGYSLSWSLVFPVMLSIYIVYGKAALAGVTGDATALTLLPDGPLKTTSAALLVVHLASCTLLLNNPLFQYLEEVLGVPTEFGWKRVVLRSSALLVQVFVQETLPHFGLLTSITVALFVFPVAFLLPPLLYLRLRGSQPDERFGKKSILSLLETAVCWVLIGATPIAMVVILYVTGSEIAGGRTVFTVPCYFNATRAHV